MPVMEAQAVGADHDTDRVDQMATATQRVTEIAETLKEDRLLMPGSRHLLKVAKGFPSSLSRRILEAVASCLELEDDIENTGEGDWVDEISAATERVMVAAGTLKEDRDLMRGALRLVSVMDGMPHDFSRRIFEVVAGVMMVEAAEQQRKARSGRGTKSER
jgi:hypothetical protein